MSSNIDSDRCESKCLLADLDHEEISPALSAIMQGNSTLQNIETVDLIKEKETQLSDNQQ